MTLSIKEHVTQVFTIPFVTNKSKGVTLFSSVGKRRDIIYSLTQGKLGNEKHVEQGQATLERGFGFVEISGQK